MSGALRLFERDDLGQLLPGGEATMPTPTFGETWEAAARNYDALDASNTRDIHAQRIGAQVVKALKERGRTVIRTGYGRNIAITPRNLAQDRQAVADRIWQEVAAERARDPEFLKDLPDAAAFERAIIESRRRDYEETSAVLGRARGAGSVVAEFGGAFEAGIQDPLTQITTALTLPFGGPIAGGFARQVALAALREGALNTAATVPALGMKARNAREIGVDYGAAEVAADLGFSFAVGGILGGGAEAAGIGLERALRGRQGARELAAAVKQLPEKTGVPLTKAQRDAVTLLQKEAEALDASPLDPDPEADAAHLGALDEAEQALAADEAPNLPPMPMGPVKPDAADVVLPEGETVGAVAARLGQMKFEQDWLLTEIADAHEGANMTAARLQEIERLEQFGGRAGVQAKWEAETDPGAQDVWSRLIRLADEMADEPDMKARLMGELEEWEAYARDLTAEREKLLADIDAMEKAPLGTVRPGDMQSGGIYEISAKDLLTDPVTFQYKGGGDAEGVTDRLRGVTEWNADAAGIVMVWQSADGKLFVADGHQRSGLARRLIEAGTYPDIKLSARVYREADGYSAERVMLMAAGANIMADSGTAMDAAKIIRRAGLDSKFLAGFNRASAFGRRAMGLSRLSDDAFGMVLNGDERDAIIGGVLGRVAPDAPELHAQLLAAVRGADVSNESQIELMLRDMLEAPRETLTQTDMFGALQVTRSLWAERAKVLDRALTAIENAKRAFASAAVNAETLEQVGTINQSAATTAAEQNKLLAAAVRKLATKTDNPINAALSRAAGMMAEGAKADAAAKAFLADLRGRPDLLNDIIRGGDGSGLAGRDAGAQRGAGADAAPEGGAGAGGAPEADAGDGAGFDPDGALGSLFGDDPGAGGTGGGGGPARPAAGTEPGLGLDGGPQLDPAQAERDRQRSQLGADAPLRPGDRAEQADVDGTPLFDAERSPDMLDGLTNDARGRAAVEQFDDPRGPAADEQAESLIHDLRAEAEAEPEGAGDDSARRGDRVTFKLPDGTEAKGKVVRVRPWPDGRMVLDIDTDRGLQNAFADEVKIQDADLRATFNRRMEGMVVDQLPNPQRNARGEPLARTTVRQLPDGRFTSGFMLNLDTMPLHEDGPPMRDAVAAEFVEANDAPTYATEREAKYAALQALDEYLRTMPTRNLSAGDKAAVEQAKKWADTKLVEMEPVLGSLILPYPQKGWRGGPLAGVKVRQLVNGKYSFGYEYWLGDGGMASPASQTRHGLGHVQLFDTAGEALEAAFRKVVERMEKEQVSPLNGKGDRAKAEKIKAWAQSALDSAAPSAARATGPTGFHGYGRATKAEAYGGLPEPILGAARYYSFDEAGAREFGPQMIVEPINIERPFVIEGDDDWFKLLSDAGVGQRWISRAEDIEKVRSHLEALGHDGVIVRWDEAAAMRGDMDPKTGKWFKTLINVFGRPQAADFKLQNGSAAPSVREADPAPLAGRIEVDGVARPTTNSDGRPIHATEDGLINFWRWFGDSKVVDEQGRPLVVYHGTDKTRGSPMWDDPNYQWGPDDELPFTDFMPGPDGGIYFAAGLRTAEYFARGGNIYEARLRVENPLELTPKQFGAFLTTNHDNAKKAAWIERAKAAGHDGIVVRGVQDMVNERSDHYVVFDGAQVKEVDNSGEFGRDSRNMFREAGAAYDLGGEGAVDLRAVLADLDDEAAAIETLKGCL